MDKNETNTLMEKFMHPTVFTGVEPLFIVAEELATQEHIGGVIDAVWVHWDDDKKNEFSYITKFAVEGKILDRNYYTSEEMEPFKGRLALPQTENFEKLVLHRTIKEEIEEIKTQRDNLADPIEKDFDTLSTLLDKEMEVSVFKKGYGEWYEPFHEIDIEIPYRIVWPEDALLEADEYMLKHPKTGGIRKYQIKKDFYAYILGGNAEISGLRLKEESYKRRIGELKNKARDVLASIEWLSLDDPKVTAITQMLPSHPFDNYFNYFEKGKERKLSPPANLLKALEIIIEEHMPKLKGLLGIEYIPIDNLLYLFHEIIPRPEALVALEACDIIHEPSGLLLGYEGKHVIPPKFLVHVTHVVEAYKKFPSFIETCEKYLD